jgi:hypothetical protein
VHVSSQRALYPLLIPQTDIPHIFSDNRALLHLDISSNVDLGQLTDDQGRGFKFSSGQWFCDGNYPEGHNAGNPCKTRPSNVKARGIIALANAIPGMRALASLNLAWSGLGAEGAKIIAAVLPECT